MKSKTIIQKSIRVILLTLIFGWAFTISDSKWTEALANDEVCTNQYHAGIFQEGNDARGALIGLEWDDFLKKWKELEAKNLRLVDFETYVKGNRRLYAGIFRAGTYSVGAYIGKEWPEFLNKWQELESKNLRMVDFETYTQGGKRLYAGIFHEGTYPVGAYIGKEWNEFFQKWKELEAKNLRLIDIETYEVGSKRLYAGIFHKGTYAKAALVGLEWKEFKPQWTALENKGFRMLDLETYTEGSKRLYAGIFKPGNDGHAAWMGVDYENFLAQWHGLEKKNLRLTDIEFYSGSCDSDCLNQVVAPGEGIYTRKIKSTSLHCEGLPGSCGTPGADDTVLYSAPVDVDGTKEYARLSALYNIDKILTLPFDDTGVKMSGGWRYSDGGWHHATDYSKSGESFKIVATAPGRVIHIGWDPWGGGTLILSHDAGGEKDVYRTIYRHIRNGKDSDCNSAWSISVPTLSGDNLKDYKAYLENTGCEQKKADRKPDEKYWGKNSDAIDKDLLGKTVTRGQFLGWSGNTGPGGKKGTSASTNIHLHVFWAHRDPVNKKWYFFDPYGIYAKPVCHPAGTTDPLNTPCSRYPVAWKDGKPQLP